MTDIDLALEGKFLSPNPIEKLRRDFAEDFICLEPIFILSLFYFSD